MTELTWSQVGAGRLSRHGLVEPLAGGPADVVSAMAGTHAQVTSAAELSIALRLDDGTSSDVRDALWTTRELVKTFGPRGTVHLLPTTELPMWVGAMGEVPTRQALPLAGRRDVVCFGPDGAPELVDGGGGWHHKRSGRRLAVTVEPFVRPTAARHRELAEQLDRIGSILGAAPELTIGEVPVGGHA